MSEYPNSGAVWRNDKKENENQPHFRGSAEVDGKDYWVSVWMNPSEGGRPPLKFKFEEKQPIGGTIPPGEEMEALAKLAEPVAEPKREYKPGEDFSDDIPF